MNRYLVTIRDVDSMVEPKVEVQSATAQGAHKKAMFEELASFETEQVVQITNTNNKVVFNEEGFIDYQGDI